ncbi:MAG: hypothetical protein ACQEWM_03190 [Actinomycetota bacterium]
MTRTRLAAIGLLVLALSGCAVDGAPPADSAPAAPTPSATSSAPASADPVTPSPAPAGTASPAPAGTASPPAGADGWARFEVGDGHTSWRMPEGWTADIASEVVEGRAEWTDYRGLVRDEAGVPMLRFEAIASGGQYATDFTPCERPETEVLEVTPLGDQVVDPGALVVAVAFDDAHDGVTFAAGVSENDAETACEPDILTLYQGDGRSGYDYLLLQIVDDDGTSYPRFAGFDEARAYLATSEYALIREVLLSFESR